MKNRKTRTAFPIFCCLEYFTEKYEGDTANCISSAALPGQGTAHPAVLPDGYASPRAFVGNAACTAKYLAHTHFIAGLHRGVGCAAHPHRCPALSSMHTTTAPAAIGVHGGHLTGGGSTHLCILRTGVVHTVRGCASRQGCCCTPAHRRCRRSRPCPRRAAWRQAQLNCWQARMRPAVRRFVHQTRARLRPRRGRRGCGLVHLPQILRRRSRAAAIHRPPVGQG